MIKIGSRVRCRLTGATGDVVAINEPEIIDRLGPFGIDKVPRVYVVDIGRAGTIPRESDAIEAVIDVSR
jgi:hypothetical protein